MNRSSLSLFLLSCLSLPLHADEPFLFFDEGAVPVLRERIEQPRYNQIWQALKADADAFITPGSPLYAAPEAYAQKPIREAENSKTRVGHSYGRDLTTWCNTLGFAWQMTGDEAYARHGIALLLAGTTPAVTEAVMTGRFPGMRGDMMRALATGLDLFSDAMTDEQRAQISAVAREYLIYHAEEFAPEDSPWRGTRRNHNFSGVCGGAIGMLAILLHEDYPDEAPAWLNLGREISRNWLAHGLDEQGACVEGVLYMNYALGNLVIFADALYRFDGERELLDNPNLQNVPLFLAMEILPGEQDFDARNDSLYRAYVSGRAHGSPYLLLMASGFSGATEENPLAAWLWQSIEKMEPNFLQIVWGNSVTPRSPEDLIERPYGEHFEGRGLCVWRTGWSKQDTMFSIESGLYRPITHNQADKGSFTFYGLGYRWAVDTGYGNNKTPDGRCQTVAHNCVLIDGKGQALSGAGLGTDGQVVRYENNERYGYALTDNLSAYQRNNAGVPSVPLSKALRHAFYLRPADDIPAYAVVLDDIEWDEREHEFTWQMITWANMTVTNDASGSFTLQPPGKQATPHMQVLLHAADSLSLDNADYQVDNLKGRPPNDYVRLRANCRAVNPYFVAVLAPLPPGAPEPVLSVEDAEATRTIRIDWGTRTDTIVWTPEENEAILQP